MFLFPIVTFTDTRCPYPTASNTEEQRRVATGINDGLPSYETVMRGASIPECPPLAQSNAAVNPQVLIVPGEVNKEDQNVQRH